MAGPDVDRRKIRIVEGTRGHTVWWKYDGIVFGGVYLAPGLSTAECEERLTPPRGMLGDETSPCVLIGDFNMRLGSSTGDRIATERGRELAGWLMQRGLSLRNDNRGTPTATQPRVNGGSSIVDLVWSNLGADRHPSGVRVVEEDDIGGSDHRMITTEITTARREARRPEDQPRLALNRLKKAEVRARYQERVNEALERLDWTKAWQDDAGPEHIEWLNRHTRDILLEAARATVGERGRRKRGSQLLLDQDLRKAKAQRRRAWQRWRDEGSEATLEAYRQARREQGQATKRAKERVFQEFAARVGEMEDTEVSKIISALAKRQGRGASLLAADEESLETYAEHFERQFSLQGFHQEAEEGEPGTADMAAPTRQEAEEEVPFSTAEVAAASRWLPRGKAPGASGLTNELIKEAPPGMSTLIWLLFRACWRGGRVPDEWSTALIHPVPKKGDLSVISNYRPISLTENLRKLFEKCLAGPLTRQLDRHLDMAQGGFRSKRSTLDQVACLHEMILQERQSRGKPPLVAYLDIKAAYDTVHRPALWSGLRARGTEGAMLRVLKALFEPNRSRVVVQGNQSRTLRHPAGLLQGSILSPILYATHIDGLAGRLRDGTRLCLGGQRTAAFMYADDIALVAVSAGELARQLATCEQFSVEKGFRFQPVKCEIVAGEGEDTTECRLYGQPLKRVRTFTYLGVTMNERGIDREAHVERLCGKTLDSTHMMREIGFNGAGHAFGVKQRMWRTFIRPKLEYGLQLIKLAGRTSQRLESAMHHALRTMFGVGRGTSGAALLELAGEESMQQRALALNAAWATRTAQLGETFMVHHGRAAHNQRAIRGSAFAGEQRNAHMARYRDATVWSGRDSRKPPGERRELLRDIRREEKAAEREQRRILKAHQAEHIRPDAGRAIDGVEGRSARRLLVLWLLRRLIGKPAPCQRCLADRATYRHVQACTGHAVDAAVKAGHWTQAAQWIAAIAAECLGRPPKREAWGGERGGDAEQGAERGVGRGAGREDLRGATTPRGARAQRQPP
jgi:hypothetical protein